MRKHSVLYGNKDLCELENVSDRLLYYFWNLSKKHMTRSKLICFSWFLKILNEEDH